jgi:putative hemolysin
MRIFGLADPKLNFESCNPQNLHSAPDLLRKSTAAPAASKLGAFGSLELILTREKRDVRRLQKLRYHVFYEQGRAIGGVATRFTRRDSDSFDNVCDHLMVVDRSARSSPIGRSPVIGTYRLLRQEIAKKYGGFSIAREFDIFDLLERHAGLRFLELGRSCVLSTYRTKRTIELLWHGVWRYVRDHHIDVMIGCASFATTDAAKLARPLSYLHHFALAPEPWQAAARPKWRVEMNRMSKHEIDIKAAWRELPPLIKGYLRVGALVGDGAAIDEQFGTTDVLIVMPVSAIRARYINYFGENARRFAG